MKNIFFILSLLFIFCQRNTQPPPSNKVLINGDFEQALNIGWTQNNSGISNLDLIDRAANLDADSNYELIIEKIDAGHIKLSQTVDISSTDRQFSIKTKMSTLEYNSYANYWAAAAVCLRYLNNNNNLLGETRLVNKSPHCPWSNSNTLHLIEVTDTTNWHTYSFNLNNELNNLPGINRNNVKKIQIALLDTTNGC